MPLENKTIMLIEDDEIDIQAVKRIFKDLKIKNILEVAKDGEEAFQFLMQHKSNVPALILVDINMPKTNGVEFLKSIKQRAEFKKIPVVVLTTSNAASDVLRSYECGAAGYLIKDMDYQKFVNVMNTLFSYWNVCELP